MDTFIVRHISSKNGSLEKHRRAVKKNPFSLTNKKGVAEEAKHGGLIYVVESVDGNYNLAYRFRCTALFKPAGNGLFEDNFIYKNTVAHGEDPELVFFDKPKHIADSSFYDWFTDVRGFGMCALPSCHHNTLNQLILDA